MLFDYYGKIRNAEEIKKQTNKRGISKIKFSIREDNYIEYLLIFIFFLNFSSLFCFEISIQF
jgi:hypothetical protein